MSVAAPLTDHLRSFADAHARIAGAWPGGGEWRARRAQALERCVNLGLPTQRDESWKYTPMRLLEKRLLQVSSPEPAPLAADAFESSKLMLEDVRTLVFCNGRLMPSLSDGLTADAGVQCEPLAESLRRSPGELLDRIGIPGDSAEERLALLNVAFLAEGVDVRVAAGIEGHTLYLLFLSSGSRGVHHPRVLIDVGPNAQLQVIEHHVGLGQAESATNCVTDIRLDDHARLEHLILSEAGARGIVLNSVCATQDAGSRLSQYRVLLSGQLSRASLNAALPGRSSEIEANALLLADQRENLEVHSVIGHRAPETRSVERFRGIASDRGRGVFNGRIVVHPGATKTESQQSSRALLLSEQAEIYSRPQLEILNDDVKCSHGATTGRLDPNMLFYLLSRGLDAAAARALLIYAFLDDVLARLGLIPLRRQLERRIARALPQSQHLGELE